MQHILIIGNSDGIGLELTQTLLKQDPNCAIWGVSRSPSPIVHERYTHTTHDITLDSTQRVLHSLLQDAHSFDALIYCAGIGDPIDLDNLSADTLTFQVNTLGLVRSIEAILPSMLHNKRGHILGLSSLADALVSKDAPAYSASKAAASSYLEGLALNLRPTPIRVTNVRFGFVDTKMAKSPVKPMMMSRQRAVQHILKALRTRPIRLSRPLPVAAAIAVLGWATHATVWALSLLGG